MATPAFTIQLQAVNLLVLTDTDTVPLYFAIYQLNDTGDDWNPLPIAPLSPLNENGSLPASGVFQMVLADNLYKVFISDAPLTITDPIDTAGYYVLADNNIKACERTMLLNILCGSGPTCNPIADCKQTNQMLKFFVLQQGLYFIYSNWIQKQAITMLIVPTNQELLSMRDYLNQLLDMCGCNSQECKQCTTGSIGISNWVNIGFPYTSNSDCGCN